MRENIFRCRAFHAGLIAGALALTPLLFSCTEDMESGVVENHQQQISFSISGLEANSSASTRADASESSNTIEMDAAEGEQPLYLHVSQSKDFSAIKGSSSAATRGEPISSVGDGQVAIYGYQYSGSWSESLTPNFFQNDSLLTDFQESVVTSYPWPGKDSLKFFAIPKWVYNAGATRTLTGSPSITYTVPDSSASQPDIMLASNRVPGDYYNTVPLSFKHIMTGVVIKLAADFPATAVSSIKFTGVLNAGTYSMADSTWTLDSSTDDFTASGVDTVTLTSGSENTIVNGANTFMLLPQTLPDDATLEITYTESGSSVTRKALIGGTSWPMGTIVTYTLSKSDLEFTFVVTGPDNYTYAGGTDQYQVTSYSTSTSSGSSAVGWTATFVDDDGNEIDQPDWLTAFTLSGDGSTSATDYDATVAAQEGVTLDPHADTLQARTARGSSGSPYDLSTHAPNGNDTTVNTANCYVVNAPGTYSFPLVYGNAIVDGSTNESSYSTTWLSGRLTDFIDYQGNEISSPYIYDNTNYTIKDAVLVWEDQPELIDSIRLSSDGHSVIFKVPQSSIKQGNAVIAVRDNSETIMWSWHIWVTDYILGTDLRSRSYSGTTFTFLQYNLGWTDGSTTDYDDREVLVKFTQNVTGDTATITIRQKDTSLYNVGNCPFYQWGRKDPIIPSVGKANYDGDVAYEADNKTWYDSTGQAHTNVDTATDWGTGDDCIINGIQNPSVFYAYNLMDNTYYNLWDVIGRPIDGNSKESSVKSIYDPCPVGYKIPPVAAFRAFTNGGNNASSVSNVYGEWDSEHLGWIINCTEGDTFLPAAGCRSVTASSTYPAGGTYEVGIYGFYWTSTHQDTGHGHFLQFHSTSFSPLSGNNYGGRGRGFVVRPIAE